MAKISNKAGVISVPEDPSCVPDNRGYGALCFDKMVEFGERIAQIDALTDESWTYKQLLTKCIRVAMAMESMGIQSDDIVTLCTGYSMESDIPILAAQFLGLRVASLDPTLVLDELQHLLSMVKPRFIFTVPESTSHIVSALEALNVSSTVIEFGGESKRHISFKSLLEPHEAEDKFRPKLAGDIFETAFIFFSSGTTGLPKGVCLGHYGLLYLSAFYEHSHDMQCTLCYTSSYWITHVLGNTMTLMAGGRRVICGDFDAKTVMQCVEKYKITIMFLAPFATYSITADAGNFNYDTASLQTMVIGGSTIAERQINKLRTFLPHTMISTGYGITELAGMVAYLAEDTADEALRSKSISCGRIVAGLSCKIVDLETNEIVGTNKRGELMVKSKTRMNGYYEKEEETRLAFDEDGYFHTGDIGYFDEYNHLHIVDRLKSMFKYKSWHIIPAELESVLLKHHDVLEAVVLGVPHEEDGDVPMAVIVPKPGSQCSERDIIAYFNEQVNDRKKLRAGVKFVTNIPKTSTGKYNRRSLLKIVMQDRTEPAEYVL